MPRVPDPPPTPRLSALLAATDNGADPLHGTATAALALRVQLRAWLGGRGGLLQELDHVPLIHRAPVMEHFGFQRRHMPSNRSFKYIAGYPAFVMPVKGGAQPIRGRPLWGVHPALSFTCVLCLRVVF